MWQCQRLFISDTSTTNTSKIKCIAHKTTDWSWMSTLTYCCLIQLSLVLHEHAFRKQHTFASIFILHRPYTPSTVYTFLVSWRLHFCGLTVSGTRLITITEVERQAYLAYTKESRPKTATTSLISRKCPRVRIRWSKASWCWLLVGYTRFFFEWIPQLYLLTLAIKEWSNKTLCFDAPIFTQLHFI